MKKRAIALLLTLSMVVTAVPGTVWAEEPAGGGEEAVIEEVGEEMVEVEDVDAGEAAAVADVAEDVIVEDTVEIDSMEEIALEEPEAVAPVAEAEPVVELDQTDVPTGIAADETNYSDELAYGSSKKLSVTLNKNSTVSWSGLVNPSSSSEPFNTNIKVPYNPKDHMPALAIKWGEDDWKKDIDYTVNLVSGGSKAGEQTVIRIHFTGVDGIHSAISDLYLKYEIEALSLADEANKGKIAADYAEKKLLGNTETYYSFIYNGKVQHPTDIKVTYDGVALNEGTDYVLSGGLDNKNAGANYKVEIKGEGNYTGEVDIIKYDIIQKTVAAGDIVLPERKFYVGVNNTKEKIIEAIAGNGMTGEDNTSSITDMGDNKLVWEGTATGTNDFSIKFYKVENNVTDTNAEILTKEDKDPLGEGVYAFRIGINGSATNFKAKDESAAPIIEGRFEVLDSAVGLKQVYESVESEIAKETTRVYNGSNQFDAISDAITEAFKKFGNVDTVKEPHSAESLITIAVRNDEKIINKGTYVVEISGKADTIWAEEGKISVPVTINAKSLKASTGSGLDTTEGTGFKMKPDLLTQYDTYDGKSKLADPVISSLTFTTPAPENKLVKLVLGTDYVIVDRIVKKGNDDAETAKNQERNVLDKIVIEGQGNFKDKVEITVKLETKVDLSDEKAVNVRVKPLGTGEGFFTAEQGGVDLTYGTGAGIKLTEKNIEVWQINDAGEKVVISPDDYYISRDTVGEKEEDKVKDPNCSKETDGKHKSAGKHYVKITGKNKCTGARDVEFTIAGVPFDSIYKADTSAVVSPTVDKETKTGEEPHKKVKVVNGNKTLNGPDAGNDKKQYDFYGYIRPEQKEALEAGTLDKKNVLAAEDHVEFSEAGTWLLVIQPFNADVEGEMKSYSGYLYAEITVLPKEFKLKADGGSIEVTAESINWPGHAVTAEEISRKLTVKDTDKIVDAELEYGKQYTIVEESIDKAGTSKITLKGADGSNYGSETIEVEITVNPISLENAVIDVQNALDYKGEAFNGKIEPSSSVKVTVTVDGKEVVVESEDYTVEAVSEGADVGSKVTVKVAAVEENGHYTKEKTVEGTIKEANVGDETNFEITGVVDKVYAGGAEVKQDEAALKLVDKRTTPNKEIKVKAFRYENNKEVGTAAVYATPDDANYTGEAKAEFQIKEPGLGEVELKAASFPYTGKALTEDEIIAAVKDADGVVMNKADYKVSFKGNLTDAGTKVAVVTMTVGGKEVSIEKSFTIEPAEIKADDVTFVDKTPFTYTGSVIRPKVQVTVNGVTLKETTDYYVMNTEEIRTGKMNLVVVGIGNYTSSPAKDFEVVPATLDGAKISKVKATYKYTGQVIRPEAKVTLNGKKLVKGKDYQLLNTESAEVGKKDLVVLGIGGYEGSSKLVNFTVKPAKAEVKSVEEDTKQLTVKVKKQSGASYQVKYRVKGTSEWKSVKVKEGSAKKVLKELTSGKKYQVKVRAYVTVDGERVNGAWSAVKVSGKVK